MENTPFILVAKDCSLPTNEQECSRFLEDLSSAISDVCVKYKMYPEWYRIYDGHLYAQTSIHVSCPKCNSPLQLRNFDLGPENGADAQAKCECGWSGIAQYRLIDLQENINSIEQKLSSDGSGYDLYSAVAAGESPVTYTPYQNTGTHFITPGDGL